VQADAVHGIHMSNPAGLIAAIKNAFTNSIAVAN
jgi:hypothetical protein